MWLAEDDPDACLREAILAMADWSLPGFHIEHFYALFAEVNADLYAGRPERARERQLVAWPKLQRSHLLRIPAARVTAIQTRARAALAIAARTPGAHEPLLREAEQIAKRLAKERLPFCAPTSALLAAGVARTRGRASEATELLKSAAAGFEAQGMKLMAIIARRCMGPEEAVVADEAMRAEGIAAPARMAAMFAPGFEGTPD